MVHQIFPPKTIDKVIPTIPLSLTKNDLMKIFKSCDVNSDGLLSREELRAAFKRLGAIFPGFRADRGLKHADADGDGYISEEEMDNLVKYAYKLGYTVKK